MLKDYLDDLIPLSPAVIQAFEDDLAKPVQEGVVYMALLERVTSLRERVPDSQRKTFPLLGVKEILDAFIGLSAAAVLQAEPREKSKLLLLALKKARELWQLLA